MAVAAQFDILPKGKNQRGDARHHMRLRVRSAPSEGEAADVLVHNLSATGLLLESASQLVVDDEIMVELPESETITAKVVWASGQFFGCAFDRPLSAATVSAAQLRSDPTVEASDRHESTPAGLRSAPESFGARLHRLRRERGMTLVEFARRAKVSRPTVWSWEADRSTPRRSKTRILLEVLGVTEEELYGTSGASAESRRREADPARRADELRCAIEEAKERLAGLAGTSPDKIRLIIEI